MSTIQTVRTVFLENQDEGKYYPHHGHVTGPVVWVSIDFIDSGGVTQLYRFRVIVRCHEGRWVNVTLARTGQSIAQLRTCDYRNAGVFPGDKSRPKQVAQALINRIAHDHGRQNLARTLANAEQAGPVANPEILGTVYG